MRFVKADRPGVWYVTTAPEGPKVHELDRGRVALLTSPTPAGATISSNRVQISRAPHPFPAVADLYRAQVPGYMDGMTDERAGAGAGLRGEVALGAGRDLATARRGRLRRTRG